ncbi:hypothetical protein LUQ84_001314 [Hamiltosporidium tvaerminnensis]|nr:hypothetical protein LUQ84_001314 [Hamiltosporidium tvaerminnensis]
MFSKISYYRNNFYILSGTHIIILDSNANELKRINHELEVVFIKYNYLIDRNKCLYKLENLNLKFICTIKKMISNMFKYNEDIYLVDRFGDIYKIYESIVVFVCGNMCFTTGILIYNDNIISSDKYGRIKIYHKIHKKILNYLFLFNSPITSLDMNKNFIIASEINGNIKVLDLKNMNELTFHKIEDIKILKKIMVFDEKLMVLCDKGTFVFEIDVNGKLIFLKKYDFEMKDSIMENNNLLFIDIDNMLWFNDIKVLETIQSTDDYIGFLNY